MFHPFRMQSTPNSNGDMMKVLLIEPFYSGSHKAWADQWKARSRHQFEFLTMPGLFWRWRMEGGTVTLAKKYLDLSFQPDLIIASDMLDLGRFLALTRKKTASIPTCVYFHENQLSYPWSPHYKTTASHQRRNYGWTNITSALAADWVWFNSNFHRQNFISSTLTFLQSFNDFQETESAQLISDKSSVMQLAVDLHRFDAFKTPKSKKPLILWNHRWIYDKNPEEFFQAIYALQDKNIDFDVVVLGETQGAISKIFTAAKQRLGSRVLHMGYVDSFAEYATWLWRSTHIPVTSIQDFFGISAVEGIYCQAIPLLPERLAFPDHLPANPEVYYNNKQLVPKLESQLGWQETAQYADLVAKYDWSYRIEEMDNEIDRVVGLGAS